MKNNNNNNDNMVNYTNDNGLHRSQNIFPYGNNHDNNITDSNIHSYNSQISSNYNINHNMANSQLSYHPNQRAMLSSSPSFTSVTNKTTAYLGNLKDNITKQQIQYELSTVNPAWKTLTIRLNLRSGWSHAFVDFEHLVDAKKLIYLWHNKPNTSLTNTRLRCEVSKRQMI